MIQISKTIAGCGIIHMVYRGTDSEERTTRIDTYPGCINLCAPGELSVEQTREFIRSLELACDIASRQVEIK